MEKLITISILSLLINNLIPSTNSKVLFFFQGNQSKIEVIKEQSKKLGSININIALIFSIIILYIVLWESIKFNTNSNEYYNRIEIFNYVLGLDGLGLTMIGLIAILEPILLLLIRGETYERVERKRIINYIQIIKLIIILLFASLDLFVFFITFELILIPMFYLITKFGSKYQFFLPRLEAGIRFFLFTMVGSILMLITIIIFYIKYGTTSNELLNYHINDIIYLNNPSNLFILKLIWIFLFFSFLIKIPMFPLHTWLPLAHSDAPTIGSIILAALLLKLASFGIIRYSLYLFEPINNLNTIYSTFLPIIYILALLSIIYSSLIPLRGIYDLKKIVAYSSIVHMNFSIFGFFSKDFIGLNGSTFLIFTHAFISSALFLLVGLLYKRYHTRFLLYYQGLFLSMPLFSFFFLFFTFANISLPFCASFLSELFILISSLHFNFFLTILLLSSLILSSSFMIWVNNRLLFGSNSTYFSSTTLTNSTTLINSTNSSNSSNSSLIGYKDLTIVELLALIPFLLLTLFFAFFPNTLLNYFTLPLILFN